MLLEALRLAELLCKVRPPYIRQSRPSYEGVVTLLTGVRDLFGFQRESAAGGTAPRTATLQGPTPLQGSRDPLSWGS